MKTTSIEYIIEKLTKTINAITSAETAEKFLPKDKLPYLKEAKSQVQRAFNHIDAELEHEKHERKYQDGQ